jgi:hypothetical protein
MAQKASAPDIERMHPETLMRELPRRRRVDPGQLPGDPEPGLIEVRHVRPGQGPGDGDDRRGDEPGDLAGVRGQRGRGTGHS